MADDTTKREWLIYEARSGTFWGPDRGGYFGLWGAGLYTEAEAKRIAANPDPARQDRAHHISEYCDQIANMRGAFERLSAALDPASQPAVSARDFLEELLADLRTMAQVAGQASLEALNSDDAAADAKFAEYATRWADKLALALTSAPR